MSLKYGLNVKKTAPSTARRPIFDDEDGDDDGLPSGEDVNVEEEIRSVGRNGFNNAKPRLAGSQKPGTHNPGHPPPRRKEDDERQDLSAIGAAKARVKVAEELDSSIFDYDSFHDAKTTVTEAKQAAARQDAVERKPKYINNLLESAARRKHDQLIAREKLLQKEREAEGDEFADKEKFVTGAYKEHQEEARKLEEEEKKAAEMEAERKRKLGGGMQGFYKTMMDQTERQHQETMEAAARIERDGGAKATGEKTEKSEAELAAELGAKGLNVQVNEEGQIVDKRELLSAGLNIAPANKSNNSSGGADHLRSSNRPAQASAFQRQNAGGQQAQRERQSKMMEEQLAAQAKRAREEEDEERARLEKASKTQKTEKNVSDARARYLARKAAK